MASEPGPPESMLDAWSSAAPAETPGSGVTQGAPRQSREHLGIRNVGA